MIDKKDTKKSNPTPFHVEEAYKTLRTNLMFALSTVDNKAIVISSARQEEGKSETSARLATVMAELEVKVILIDADMRKPTQHKIFKCSNQVGLSTILSGNADFEEAIRENIKPNLDIITSGKSPPNPSELLGTDRMTYLLEELSRYYDYIFIDTPPINLITDAVILSGKSAGVVLVTRHGKSTYNELTKAVSRLEFSGANILGLVVNAVKSKSRIFGRYGRYGKYGYGEYGKSTK